MLELMSPQKWELKNQTCIAQYGSKFDKMNPAGFPHFNGQFCSFVAYLCGCGQRCGHMAWPYDVACYGSPV